MRKKMIIAILLVFMIATPSYAIVNHPIKNLMKKVASFFKENPFTRMRRLIQKDYDDDKISKEEYDNRMDDVDRQEEAAKEYKRQLLEQRRQAAAQRAAGN